MNEVIPGLWIGSSIDGLKTDGFNVVVNLEGGETPPCPGAMVLAVPMVDGEMRELDHSKARAAATLINMSILAGKQVLVYCSAGWNRSGVVAARALMGRGFSAEEAIAAVRKARGPMALSNSHFVEWLKAEGKE